MIYCQRPFLCLVKNVSQTSDLPDCSIFVFGKKMNQEKKFQVVFQLQHQTEKHLPIFKGPFNFFPLWRHTWGFCCCRCCCWLASALHMVLHIPPLLKSLWFPHFFQLSSYLSLSLSCSLYYLCFSFSLIISFIISSSSTVQ